MEKQQEKKVLGIIATVLGVIALLLSWMPIVNNFAAVLAFIGFILGIIALIVNRKNKKTLSIVGTILSVISIIIVIATQGMYTKAIDKSENSVSSSSSSVEKVSDKSASDDTWTFKNNIFDAGNMTYKITNTEITDGAGDPGTKVLVMYMDVTNNSDKEMDPSNLYMVMHAYQKTDTSNVNLNPGTVALNDQAESPVQTEEDAMNNKLLPKKTTQVVAVYQLENTNDIKVEFSNSDFKTIGTKIYKFQQ
ncbi:prophage protein [Weissella koreensis KCTC 3621]|uniref:DUF5067 domain-containing protein n=1 Tax=Weissella koreensis TaxID=165096 RepID=UPI00026F3EF1|nr:DUF5067 domain-containing protein [Weissella koreensis]EJF33753.1 prophage protein [Weissella koreensis KCTC 3621]